MCTQGKCKSYDYYVGHFGTLAPNSKKQRGELELASPGCTRCSKNDGGRRHTTRASAARMAMAAACLADMGASERKRGDSEELGWEIHRKHFMHCLVHISISSESPCLLFASDRHQGHQQPAAQKREELRNKTSSEAKNTLKGRELGARLLTSLPR